MTNPPPPTPPVEPWVPTSRQEWSEVFADGIGLHETRTETARKEREEAEAKAKAEGGDEGEGGDNPPAGKRDLGSLLLGARKK